MFNTQISEWISYIKLYTKWQNAIRPKKVNHANEGLNETWEKLNNWDSGRRTSEKITRTNEHLHETERRGKRKSERKKHLADKQFMQCWKLMNEMYFSAQNTIIGGKLKWNMLSIQK